MRVLLYSMSSLVIAFSLLIAAAVVVSRGQPPPARVGQLHLEDCQLPCWIGITPGETSADTVNRHLMETFHSTNSELSSSVPQYQWYTIVPLKQPPTPDEAMPIEFSVSDGVIEEVLIPAFFGNGPPDVPMPRLGDVVNLLGEPACVDPYPVAFQGVSLIYAFETTVLEIGVLGEHVLRWTQPVYYMSIRRNDLSLRVNGCTWAGSRLPAWTGLARPAHYFLESLKLA